jgi:hypothetical protein
VELAIVPFAVGVIFWLPLTLPRVIMRVIPSRKASEMKPSVQAS